METSGIGAHVEPIPPEAQPDTAAVSSARGLTSEERWARTLDTAVVVILAMASLLAAWGGHQASLWNGEQTDAIATAETRQVEATRATMIGSQEFQIDVAMELSWLRAMREENPERAAFYEGLFSPHLNRAIAAWMATDPFQNPDAPTDPFEMPEYQIPQFQAAAAFDEEAGQAFLRAERAGSTGDAYVLATMLLAVVLFLAGVCTKIAWRPAQLTLLGLSVLLLFYCVQKLGALPDGSSWELTPLWG